MRVAGKVRGEQGFGDDVDNNDDNDNDNNNDAEETNTARSFVSFSLEKETKEPFHPPLLSILLRR